jgi:hypothetical protein
VRMILQDGPARARRQGRPFNGEPQIEMRNGTPDR